MTWIVPSITVALGIVLIASGVLHILRERSFRNVRSQRDRLNTENEGLHKTLDTQIKWNTKLDTEHKKVLLQLADDETQLGNLHAQNADLREALQEAQAEIKALQMQTIEVREVAPEQEHAARYQSGLDTAKPERRPVRRNMSKKTGEQE